MKIEIIPRDAENGSTSFDLEINGKKKIEDTGIADVCEHLLSNFGKFCREDALDQLNVLDDGVEK